MNRHRPCGGGGHECSGDDAENFVVLHGHPDAEGADISLAIPANELQWTPDGNGNSSARTMLAAASFGDTRRPLAAHIVNVTTTATAASLQGDEGKVVPIQVTIRVPRRTRSVRVVAMIEPGGKIGTAEVSRRDLNAAPAAPTPQPRLNLRPSRSSSANQ